MPAASRTLHTVGHGRLSAADLVALLSAHGIAAVVDVRRHPASRRNPQHGRERLARALDAGGIAYRWEPGLGGRRDAVPGSANTALADPALRAYADHMATAEFRACLDALIAQTATTPAAVLCAEGDWRHCHRRFIADAVVLGARAQVRHLRHDGDAEPHTVHAAARLAGGVPVYDRGQLPLGETP